MMLLLMESEAHRTIFKFSDLLDGLTELRNAITFMLWFITVKGYTLTLAKEKGIHGGVQ